MNNKLIELKNISKAFDGETVLDDISLYICDNEFISLLLKINLPCMVLTTGAATGKIKRRSFKKAKDKSRWKGRLQKSGSRGMS